MRFIQYRTGLAIGAILVAVLFLSFGDAVIKAAGLKLPLWQIYVLRSVLVLPVLYILVARRGGLAFRSLTWVVVRSALLAAMWICYYLALPHMPLANAAAAYYTSPILITLIAAAVERRRPGLPDLSAVALGFAGVLLVMRPDPSDFRFVTVLPLLAALLYACAMVLTSKKCSNDDPFSLAFALNVAFLLVGAVLGLFAGRDGSFLFGPWQAIDLRLLTTVAVLALAIAVGSVGAAIAYQKGHPVTVASFDYSYLVFSVLWGVLFFSEFPDIVALAGIAFIAGGGLLAVRRHP